MKQIDRPGIKNPTDSTKASFKILQRANSPVKNAPNRCVSRDNERSWTIGGRQKRGGVFN